MDILYLLIPLSLVLVLLIGAAVWWAAGNGQFDDLDAEGRRILDDDAPAKQHPAQSDTRESRNV